MKKFWNWARDADTGSRTLYLNGVIAEESWFEDDITPKAFKEELLSGKGDITIWINSPGGDCIAAAQIYNMLMDYKGEVTVKIDGLTLCCISYCYGRYKGFDVPASLSSDHNPLL